MGEAVEQGGCHLGVAKDRGPFAEAQVGGDDDTGPLIELAQHMEEQRPARGAERKISQLVEDHEVELGEVFGDLPGFAFGFLLFEGVDQLDRGEEADLPAMMFDGLNAECCRNMGLSGTRTADQHDILRPVDELAAVQLAHNGFVDLAGGEVEAREVLVGRPTTLPSTSRCSGFASMLI